MLRYLNRERRLLAVSRLALNQWLALLLLLLAVAYVTSLIGNSASQYLQFTFNGVTVGAIYAMLALGFTMVYGTVWFFDLAFGAMAAMGAYSVFYLTAKEVQTVGRGEVNNINLNIAIGLLVVGALGWVLYTWLYPSLSRRVNSLLALALVGLCALGTGAYTGLFLENSEDLNIYLSPVIGAAATGVAALVLYRGIYVRLLDRPKGLGLIIALAGVGTLALGAFCGLLVARTSGSALYLSWGVSALLAGAMGLVLYRGLYFYMRRRARSPLVMLVASLGVLLAITAFISIIFSPTGRTLPPNVFGSDPWTIGGASIKPFQVFIIGVAFIAFASLLLLLKKTSFGKAVRAISDDEEVAKIVGINTTVIIAAVFFIGAAIAAMAGILNGHDTAIQPRMGLLLLLKGWIAAVVGGIGNIYGAILGGFVLGLVEQYGIWYLAGEWKDAIAFALLILFLAFWPKGLLPRK
ncbi:MAG: branched-chain amino acid ABC transporter permease [Dehalococcoidia bacterium]